MNAKHVLQKLLDWIILLVWLVAGCWMFLAAANLQKPSLLIPLINLVILAIVPIGACLIALRHRKRAAQILFIDGLLAACYLIIGSLLEWADDEHPLHSLLVILGFVAIFFAVPGIYWLITARLQWPHYIHRTFSILTKLAFGICGFLILLAGSFYTELSWEPIGDCNPPLFVAPKYPGHNAYTAKIIYADHKYLGWSLARTEHRYWGISGWNQTFTILPDMAGKVGSDYLVEGHIRRSLAGYLFNIVEIHCTRTGPVITEAAELHLLQTGRVHDGVRIIGQVWKGDSGVAARFPVTLVLDHGPEIMELTDAQGVFDYTGMPPGQYDIHLKSVPGRVYSHGQCSDRLSSGQIAECTLSIPASSLEQQK